MTNNSFGRLFTMTTFGESHGPAIGCVVDGCPSRIPLSVEDIQPMMERRRPGSGSHVSQRREMDKVEIISGVFENLTTGHPICMLIHNTDQRSADYSPISDVFRPGHADGVYMQKYGHRDPRGGGRASARETAARVAAGAVAKKVLSCLDETASLRIRAGIVSLGPVNARPDVWMDEAIDGNSVFCPDPNAVKPMLDALSATRLAGDSLGGVVEARISGVPAGLGEPMYDKIDARIAQACMGLNAVKGVEIGDGFNAARATGSTNNDQMQTPASGKFEDAFMTNHAGGVLGGISTGQDIIVRVALKPTPSIRAVQQTVDRTLRDTALCIEGRHDPVVAIRAVPVIEAMLWLIMTDFVFLNRYRSGLSIL